MTSPDYVFISAGVAALVGALVVLVRGIRGRQGRLYLSALLWTSLATGCFLQGFAPNLKVERNAFIMPVQNETEELLNPRILVERERKMKLLSSAFMAAAALGLFFQYRGLLMGEPRPSTDATKESAP